MRNLANEWNPVDKPSFGRNKPLARTRGAITTKTRKQLAERSQSLCERCGRGGVVLQAAHLVRRWKLEKTDISVVAHLCLECHHWADHTNNGRAWLAEFQQLLNQKMEE